MLARFAPLHSKNFLKSTSVIKVATKKNTDDFHYTKETTICNTKIDTFTVIKDEWNTKEDSGKSIKNAFYVQRYARRHLSG